MIAGQIGHAGRCATIRIYPDSHIGREKAIVTWHRGRLTWNVALPKKPPARTRPPKVTKEVSAMGWVEDPHGQVLLVRQKRGRKLWTLPGGKIEALETVESGLHREITEETGMRVTYAAFVALYDRAPKRNLTFLYRVRLDPRDTPRPQASEIQSIRVWSTLPRNSSPSLRYFWRLLRGPSAGRKNPG